MTPLLVLLGAGGLLSLADPSLAGEDMFGRSFTNANPQLNDKLFTESMLFETRARSAVQCAAVCDRHYFCATFTFRRTQQRCQGHSKEMGSTEPSSPAVGARSFLRKAPEPWLDVPCQTDANCPKKVKSSVCFSSTAGSSCKCNVKAALHSKSRNTCETSCPKFSADFQRYRGRGFNGNDLEPLEGYLIPAGHTTDACEDFCNADATCRLFVYFATAWDGPKCYFKNRPVMDDPGMWIINAALDVFVRGCE